MRIRTALCALLAASAVHASQPRWRSGGGGEGRRTGGETKRVPAVEIRPDVRPLAIVGGDVYPVTAPPIPGGTVLLRDGRIEAILRPGRKRADPPPGYAVIRAEGLRVYPGLVAAGADGVGLHLDAFAGSGGAAALKGRVADSYDPWSESLEWAAAGGVTSAFVHAVRQGSSPLIGRGDVLKISPGEARGVLVREGAGVWAGSRIYDAKGRHDLRETIRKAREWKKEQRSKKASERQDDPAKEAVLDLAAGRVPLFLSPGTLDRTATALELGRELGLRLVLYHSHEAWALAAELAAQDVAVVQHVRTAWFKPRDSRRGNVTGGWRSDAPTILTRAGVTCAVLPMYDAIVTGGIAGRDLTNLSMEAAFAQRGGLTAQEALEAITIVPARVLGVEDRVGSLEPGKDADLALVDGDILDYRSFVRRTIVNGQVVFEAENSRPWKRLIELRDRAVGPFDLAVTGGETSPPPDAAKGARPRSTSRPGRSR